MAATPRPGPVSAAWVLLTPYAAVALPDPDTRVYRLGSRFDLDRSVSLGLEVTSRQGAAGEPAQEITLNGSVRW